MVEPLVFPKFIHYSTHADMIEQIITIFGKDVFMKPEPASALFFEFYRNKEPTTVSSKKSKQPEVVYEHFVRIFYKKAENDVEEVLKVMGQKDDIMPMLHFYKFIGRRVSNVMRPAEEECLQ